MIRPFRPNPTVNTTGPRPSSIIAIIVGFAVLFAVLLVLVISAWLNRPRAGTVMSSWLVPAHSETYQSGSICASYNNKGVCSFAVPIYSTRWVPDACYIRIQTDERQPRTADWGVPCGAVPSAGTWVTGG